MELRLIDLFSGAGGMTLGFVRLSRGNFKTIWANDFNRFAADTYNANFGNHCICEDITDILRTSGKSFPEADVVIGGPPCQGFSLLNKKRGIDERKQLWRPFFEVVANTNASAFVMENVPQLLGTPEYENIIETAERTGFRTVSSTLCAADYGVPQTRFRAFIIGCKISDPALYFPPKRTHYNPKSGFSPVLLPNCSNYVENPGPWRTVRNAIYDLPPPDCSEIRREPPPLDLHFNRNPTSRSIARYRAIPEEGMNRFDLQRLAPDLTPECWINKKSGGTDLFGRLWWDRPAFTIRTEFFKPEKGRYLHPEQHRPITHREAARFQTFPDDFVFKGTKIEVARQIGNAVPPLLAAEIANAVNEMFSGK